MLYSYPTLSVSHLRALRDILAQKVFGILPVEEAKGDKSFTVYADGSYKAEMPINYKIALAKRPVLLLEKDVQTRANHYLDALKDIKDKSVIKNLGGISLLPDGVVIDRIEKAFPEDSKGEGWYWTVACVLKLRPSSEEDAIIVQGAGVQIDIASTGNIMRLHSTVLPIMQPKKAKRFNLLDALKIRTHLDLPPITTNDNTLLSRSVTPTTETTTTNLSEFYASPDFYGYNPDKACYAAYKQTTDGKVAAGDDGGMADKVVNNDDEEIMPPKWKTTMGGADVHYNKQSKEYTVTSKILLYTDDPNIDMDVAADKIRLQIQLWKGFKAYYFTNSEKADLIPVTFAIQVTPIDGEEPSWAIGMEDADKQKILLKLYNKGIANNTNYLFIYLNSSGAHPALPTSWSVGCYGTWSVNGDFNHYAHELAHFFGLWKYHLDSNMSFENSYFDNNPHDSFLPSPPPNSRPSPFIMATGSPNRKVYQDDIHLLNYSFGLGQTPDSRKKRFYKENDDPFREPIIGLNSEEPYKFPKTIGADFSTLLEKEGFPKVPLLNKNNFKITIPTTSL